MFRKDWVNAGLSFIRDIWFQNDVMPFEQICQLVENKPSHILEYGTLCTAVRVCVARYGQGIAKNIIAEKAYTPRALRLALKKCDPIEPGVVAFWKRKFNVKILKTRWMLATNGTSEIRLRVLQ
ncbi:hypothetical protein BaRGS_00020978 [Batillaria attramentaria]|uniref:Uncharacterized protein n=1 Tax=Batillaria attramentaria TaxID=370345 RepID=A0ABD0KKS7_9CAEN